MLLVSRLLLVDEGNCELKYINIYVCIDEMR